MKSSFRHRASRKAQPFLGLREVVALAPHRKMRQPDWATGASKVSSSSDLRPKQVVKEEDWRGTELPAYCDAPPKVLSHRHASVGSTRAQSQSRWGFVPSSPDG